MGRRTKSRGKVNRSEIIKFRGKRVDNGNWVYGGLLYDRHLDAYFIITDTFDLEPPVLPCQFGVNAFEVIPETVSRFTGAKDKNGQEVYENDIVKFIINNLPGYGQVRSQTGIVGGVIEFGASFCRGIEVIGNAYENPDLLKVC